MERGGGMTSAPESAGEIALRSCDLVPASGDHASFVFQQIKTFYHHVGGFGNLLLMGQAGFLDHDETVAGIRAFAREVYPRLREEFPDTALSGRDAPAGAAAGA